MNIFLFRLINNNRSQTLDIISTIISSYIFIICIVGIIFLYVIFSHKIIYKIKTISLIILAILLDVLIINIIAKNIVFTPRPYMVLPNVYTIGTSITNSAIPSGHVSFISSILFALVISNPTLWPCLFFILIMGWSRIYNGMHWPSDILLGIIIALVLVWIANLILKPFHLPIALERKK